MSRFNSPLDHIRVAAPCNVEWDSMFGDERVRLCGQCQLNVYNLSEMAKTEAERLITQSEGRLCVRYYKRHDGSIITQNCPVGLRAIKRKLSRVASAISSAVLTFLAGVGIYDIATRLPLVRDRSVMGAPEVRIGGKERVGQTIPPSVMGKMAVSTPNFVAVPVSGEVLPIQRSNRIRRTQR